VLIREACADDGNHGEGPVLHSDNADPLKRSTILGTVPRLGIAASFSRPGVSDDHPFVESLFRAASTDRNTGSSPSSPRPRMRPGLRR
jgi:transposase InsO family protein